MSEEEFLNRTLNKIDKEFGYDVANTLQLMFMAKEKEIDRLNNIINGLEKWYEQKWNKLMKFKKDKFYNVDYAKGLSDGYYKLKELKGNNNE